MTTVRLDVPRPERLSRGVLLLRTFFGWFYVAIPHGICLFLVGIVASICQFIAFWAVLFTGRYPKGLFDVVTGMLDWQNRVSIYLNYLRDEYPSFGLSSEYPAKLTVDYPESLSRGLLLARLFLGWLYVGVPHFFCLWFRLIAHSIVSFIAWWAILFTGRIPEGMFEFMVGTYRWTLRLYGYLMFLTDEYPPFSGREEIYG